MGCLQANRTMSSNSKPDNLFLISGYLRMRSSSPNIIIPLDIVHVIEQFEPQVIWRSGHFGNVGGGGTYEHNFEAPITALKFNHFYSNGKHILIHGYRLRGSQDMMNIKLGCKTSGGAHDVIKEFDGNIVECTVYWGGWMNSVKGFKFITDSGKQYVIGSSESHQRTVRPPHGYALCGFHGGAGWFIDFIGFIFTAVCESDI